MVAQCNERVQILVILPAAKVNAMTVAGCLQSAVMTIPADPLINAGCANGAGCR